MPVRGAGRLPDGECGVGVAAIFLLFTMFAVSSCDFMDCSTGPTAPTTTFDPPTEEKCNAERTEECYALDGGWWQWVPASAPEPPWCVIPAANAPGWGKLSSGIPPTRRVEVEAGKAVVGERIGASPLDTLRLVAEALLAMGVCAAAPWEDALVVRVGEEGNTYEEWHVVRFTDGGWTHAAFKGVWFHSGE